LRLLAVTMLIAGQLPAMIVYGALKMGTCFNKTGSRQKKWRQRSKTALSLGSVALLLGLAVAPAAGIQAGDQMQAATRKIKQSVPPQYPELARRMNIQGVARVLLTVAPDGKVTDVKELGGNPVLVSSLVQAVKKWRYEAADRESNIEVRFEFK
jgi:TonB family protein